MGATEDPDIEKISGQWVDHLASTMDGYVDSCLASRKAILAGHYDMKAFTADVGTFTTQIAKDSGKTINLAMSSFEQLLPLFKNALSKVAVTTNQNMSGPCYTSANSPDTTHMSTPPDSTGTAPTSTAPLPEAQRSSDLTNAGADSSVPHG